MRRNSMPEIGSCPHCAGELLVIGRIGEHIGTTSATDVLLWRCPKCEFTAKETRYLVDGIDGDWPPSKFVFGDRTGIDEDHLPELSPAASDQSV